MSSISYTYPTQDNRANARGTCNISQVCTNDELGENTSQFGFKDVLDALNPLQQIPGVSTLYRAITGDTISSTSRMAGGAIYGGPLGLLFSAVDSGIEAGSGLDIGGHILSMAEGGEASAPKVMQAYANAKAL